MEFTIGVPDDFHVHFREGELLRAVVPATAAHFARALVMPNVPEVRDAARALAYRDEIVAAARTSRFAPLLTIKLTLETTPETIREAHAAGVVAAKLYPAGATTGSHGGIVGNPRPGLDPVLREMADCGMVLCVHGEDPDAFVMDREADYLRHVTDIAYAFSDLRVVLEHITTARAAEAVWKGPDNLAATITAHHLIHTLDDVLVGGLKPHHFCYPVPKRPDDRRMLRHVARYGSRIFFGSDSAPHPRGAKEAACGCAGVFSAPVALSVLAEVFDATDPRGAKALDEFVATRGADFYGLDRNPGRLRIAREPWRLAAEIGGVVPLLAGAEIPWRVVERTDR